LGAVDGLSGERSNARNNFVQAMKLDPAGTADLYNLAVIEAEEGAVKLSRDVASHPTADGYLQLGRLLEASHRFDDARVAYQKALELNPNLAEAKQALTAVTPSTTNVGR